MEKLIDIILNDVQNGDFDNAINSCNLLISQYPLNTVAYELRGDCYFKMKKLEHASLNYSESIELSKPKNKQENDQLSSVYNKRGLCYLSIGNFNEALLDFKNATKYNPDNAEAFNNRAKAYRKKENYSEAIKDCTKAISINPNFAEAYNNRGNVYYLMSKPQEAINDYTISIKLKPDYAGAYYNRGSAFYFLANKNEYALSDWEKAAELNSVYSEELIPKIAELKAVIENPESANVKPPEIQTNTEPFIKEKTIEEPVQEKKEESISTSFDNFVMPPVTYGFTEQHTSFSDIFSEGTIDTSSVELPPENQVNSKSSFDEAFTVFHNKEEKTSEQENSFLHNADFTKEETKQGTEKFSLPDIDFSKENDKRDAEILAFPDLNYSLENDLKNAKFNELPSSSPYDNFENTAFDDSEKEEDITLVIPESVVKLHNEITADENSSQHFQSTYEPQAGMAFESVPKTNETEEFSEKTYIDSSNNYTQQATEDTPTVYNNLRNTYSEEDIRKPRKNMTMGLLIGAAVFIVVIVTAASILIKNNFSVKSILGVGNTQYELIDPDSTEKKAVEKTEENVNKPADTVKTTENIQEKLQDKTEEKTEPKEEAKTETKKEQEQKTIPEVKKDTLIVSDALKTLLTSKGLVIVKSEDGKYWIQAGSFKDRTVAEKLGKKLSAKNPSTQIFEAELLDKGKFFRVRIGSFKNINEIETAAKKIEL